MFAVLFVQISVLVLDVPMPVLIKGAYMEMPLCQSFHANVVLGGIEEVPCFYKRV